VSKLLVQVFNSTWPVEGAVQLYQTECSPAEENQWLGSPTCLVAYLFVPLTETEVPLTD
jgi:hypothetical protein